MQTLTFPAVKESASHPLLYPGIEAARDRLLSLPGVLGIELPFIATKDECVATARPRLLVHDDEGHYTGLSAPSSELRDIGMPKEWIGQAAEDLLYLGSLSHLEDWMQRTGSLRRAPQGTHLLLTLMKELALVGENGLDDAVYAHADALHANGNDAPERANVCTLVLPHAASHHQAIEIIAKARRGFETWRALYAPTFDVIAEAQGLVFDGPGEDALGKLFSR